MVCFCLFFVSTFSALTPPTSNPIPNDLSISPDSSRPQLRLSNCEPDCEILLSYTVCSYPITPAGCQPRVRTPATESQLSQKSETPNPKEEKSASVWSSLSTRTVQLFRCRHVSPRARWLPWQLHFSPHKACVWVCTEKELQCFCHVKRASKSSALKFWSLVRQRLFECVVQNIRNINKPQTMTWSWGTMGYTSL